MVKRSHWEGANPVMAGLWPSPHPGQEGPGSLGFGALGKFPQSTALCCPWSVSWRSSLMAVTQFGHKFEAWEPPGCWRGHLSLCLSRLQSAPCYRSELLVSSPVSDQRRDNQLTDRRGSLWLMGLEVSFWVTGPVTLGLWGHIMLQASNPLTQGQ